LFFSLSRCNYQIIYAYTTAIDVKPPEYVSARHHES
jgi:hypothetical protein